MQKRRVWRYLDPIERAVAVASGAFFILGAVVLLLGHWVEPEVFKAAFAAWLSATGMAVLNVLLLSAWVKKLRKEGLDEDV